MLSIFIGLVTAGLSLWGLIHWRVDLVVVLKGLLPLCFLMGGIIAVIAGASVLGGKRSEDPTSSKKK